MRIAMMVFAGALVLAPGCKKNKAGSGETGSGAASGSAMAGSGSDMGSGSAMAGSSGSGSDTGSAAGSAGSNAGSAGSGSSASAGSGGSGGLDAAAMAHRAGNCPSTVLKSTTTAEIKNKDVLVSITSADPDAIKAIQKRTDDLLAEKKEKAKTKGFGEGHDQKGMHGGGMGLCPVYVPEGVKVSAKHEKNGVVVALTGKDPEHLKTEIDGRIQRAADWVKANIKPGDKGNLGGVGGGSGADGMNHSGSGDGKGIERKQGKKSG